MSNRIMIQFLSLFFSIKAMQIFSSEATIQKDQSTIILKEQATIHCDTPDDNTVSRSRLHMAPLSHQGTINSLRH